MEYEELMHENMLQEAFMDLENGHLMPWDKILLAGSPLPGCLPASPGFRYRLSFRSVPPYITGKRLSGNFPGSLKQAFHKRLESNVNI